MGFADDPLMPLVFDEGLVDSAHGPAAAATDVPVEHSVHGTEGSRS
ncbi:hypothetical protein ABZ478_22255 [Streptomyces sp. NPDC005706]